MRYLYLYKLNLSNEINYGFDVLSINCDQLAKFGGSLHCISFQV